MAAKRSELYEVWEDTVSVRDLVLSLVITVSLTMIGYLVVPAEPPFPLVAGLTGAVLGFIISVFLCSPKRKLATKMTDDEGSTFQHEVQEDD